MATLDQVYIEYGKTAEVAQLFETELGTFLFGLISIFLGLNNNPNSENTKLIMELIDKSTLGNLLKQLKSVMEIDEYTIECFRAALKARNQLAHGFFQKHNFAILTDEGRGKMVADLEDLRTTLHNAWQLSSAMSANIIQMNTKLREFSEKQKCTTLN